MRDEVYQMSEEGMEKFSHILSSIMNGTEIPAFLKEGNIKISKRFIDNFIKAYIKDEEYEKCHIVDTFCKKNPDLIANTPEEEDEFFKSFLKRVE
jgi:hypothetical protein